MRFSDLLTQSGWCCPWAFFESNKKVRTGLLASRLGVGERTVQDWRGYYWRGQISCGHCPKCMIDAGVNFKESDDV